MMPEEAQERTHRSKLVGIALFCIAVLAAFVAGHALGNKTTQAGSEQLQKEVAESERLQQRVDGLKDANDDLQDDLLMADVHGRSEAYVQAYRCELEKKGIDMFYDSGMPNIPVLEENPPEAPLTLKLKAQADEAWKNWSTFGAFMTEGGES